MRSLALEAIVTPRPRICALLTLQVSVCSDSRAVPIFALMSGCVSKPSGSLADGVVQLLLPSALFTTWWSSVVVYNPITRVFALDNPHSFWIMFRCRARLPATQR